MAHIHTQANQHDLTVSAFIIRVDGDEPTVMLHNHLKIRRLLQFGGHVELEENPWQGLIRELREEAGYAVDQLQVLQPSARLDMSFSTAVAHPIPFSLNTHRFKDEDHFHSDLVYAVTTSQDPKLSRAAGESADIHQYTITQLAAIAPEQIYDQTRDSATYVLEHLLRTWQAVPATHWQL
jgi:8-oxo-dGTP pyrophosphatase MutT (NUDIX family)